MTGQSRSALAGIGLMLTGVFLFSFNDAVGKWLVATYSVGQLLLIRSATTLILLAPFIWRAGRDAFVSAPRPGLQVLRIVLSTLEVAMFFWAVGYLPLADAMTFYLAGPIYVTAISALLLKEQRRLAALDRGADRLSRRRHRAAAFRRELTLAGADRARRKPRLRAADGRDARCCARPTTRC